MSESNLREAVTTAACFELDQSLRRIHHCLNQMSEEQIWWRPSESMNSIANLILHLCGNLGQYVISSVGGVLSIVHAVSHFQGHVQEIAHMTRVLTGVDYTFDFVPDPTADDSTDRGDGPGRLKSEDL